jgi:MFS family permease
MNLIALQSPTYRHYFIGSAAAVNGMWILRVVVTWLAWQVSGSATFVGLVAALSLLPTMITGPFFGVMMDRSNIIRAAYGTNMAMMTAAIVIIAAQKMDMVTQGFLIVLAICIGIITSAHHPMRLSMGPRLVERHQIGSVSALAALNFNLARVISPFVAGIVIERFGIMSALFLTLILYTPNLFIIASLRPRDVANPKAHQSIRNALVEGMSYIWSHPYLRLILITSALFSLSIRAIFEILPVIADGGFNKGATGFGQLGAAIGAGSLLAALRKAMGTSDRIAALSPQNLWVGAFGIVAMLVVTNATLWPVTLLGAACMGFSATHTGVSFQSEIQTDLPDDIRGRVMSLWGVIALGSTSVGSLLIGWMADAIGMGKTGMIGCGVALLAIIWIANNAKQLR